VPQDDTPGPTIGWRTAVSVHASRLRETIDRSLLLPTAAAQADSRQALRHRNRVPQRLSWIRRMSLD
jgi:hypothetical protein